MTLVVILQVQSIRVNWNKVRLREVGELISGYTSSVRVQSHVKSCQVTMEIFSIYSYLKLCKEICRIYSRFKFTDLFS